MIDDICQVWILITSCSAMWLISRPERWSRLGFIIGLFSQPAWLYTTYIHEQWGAFLVACWYTYTWCQGIYFNYIKKELTDASTTYNP